MKAIWTVFTICFAISVSLICPSATAQTIPKELREHFILLSIEAEDSIRSELDKLDSLKNYTIQIEGKLDSLQSVIDDAAKQMSKLKEEQAKNEEDIDAQVYELRARIRLLNMKIRDFQAQYDKYAKRRLTHNQKRALQLLGIMTAIITTVIIIDNK